MLYDSHHNPSYIIHRFIQNKIWRSLEELLCSILGKSVDVSIGTINLLKKSSSNQNHLAILLDSKIQKIAFKKV